MAGIIKGNLLDANGDVVIPGKPVTLKAVRSDGLPDVTITTNANGDWSFEVNAEVDSTVDFTFIYNGVDVGAHAVRFYETAEVVGLPYSNSRVLFGKTATMAFAVKDPEGKGIPYADVTIHRGTEGSEPVATLKTDQFGIVTYTAPPHSVYERVDFYAKANDATGHWGVQYEDGEEEFVTKLVDFDYTQQVDVNRRLAVFGGGLESWGMMVWMPPKVLFNKDTLSEVPFNDEPVNTNHVYISTDPLPAGHHNLVFAMESEYREFVVESGNFPDEVITGTRSLYPTVENFPNLIWCLMEVNLQVDGADHRPHGLMSVTVEEDGTSTEVLVRPNGVFDYIVKGDIGDVKNFVYKNPEGEEIGTQTATVFSARVRACEYSVDTLPTLGNGKVAFAVTDPAGKPVVNAFTLVNVGHRGRELVAVSDEYGIVELTVEREPGENDTVALINVGGSNFVRYVVQFTGVSVASEFRDLDIPVQGDTVRPITVTGKVYDQGGVGIKPPRLGIFDKQSLTYQPFDATQIGNDGSFTFEYGPLAKGVHDLVIGSSGIISEKRTHWSIGFPDGLRAERMNYSTLPDAYVGDEAVVAFRASIVENALLVPVVGVPVVVYISSTTLPTVELASKETDANGIAEFVIPPELEGVELNGTYSVRGVIGPKDVTTSISWVDSREVTSGFGNLQYTAEINSGDEVVFNYRPLNQDGVEMPDYGIGLTTRDHFQIGSYVPERILNADGSRTAVFPPMEDGTYDVVLHSGNARNYLSLTWGAFAVPVPAGVLLDFNSPTAAAVGSKAVISGKVVDADGLVIKPVGDMELELRDELGTKTQIKINPDGTWSFEATSDSAKLKTYTLRSDNTTLYTHQVNFIATPTLEFTGYTGDLVDKAHKARLAVMVKDSESNGVEGILVDFDDTYHDGVQYGSILTDEFGIAEVDISFDLTTVVAPTTHQNEVTASIRHTEISDNKTVRWASDSQNSVIDIVDLVVSDNNYEGNKVNISGKLVGAINQTNNSIMWLTVFNKTTLTYEMFNGSINLDGTFNIEVGPYPLGMNQAVIASNSVVKDIGVVVTEAPVVLKEIRALPYSSTKVNKTRSATVAFAAINSLDKPMAGETIELRLGSDTGFLIESKVTDDLGIVEFSILEDAGNPSSGAIGYFAVSGGLNTSTSVDWSPTGPVVELFEGFESTSKVSGGQKGLIKLAARYHESFTSGIPATDPNGKVTPWETMSYMANPSIGVFDKRTLKPLAFEVVNPGINVAGEEFVLITVDAQPDGVYDLVVYDDNVAEQVTMTWNANYTLLKPNNFQTLGNVSTEFVANTTTQWLDGTATGSDNAPIELTGYLTAIIAGNEEHPVWITPTGRFVTKLVESRPAGTWAADFKVDGEVVSTVDIKFHDQMVVTLLPYTTPNPAKGKDAVIAAVLKDGLGEPIADACVTFTPGARSGWGKQVNLKSNFNGVVETTWTYDDAYPEFTLQTGVNGGKAGEAKLMRWVETPELTGDSFETLVVPEKNVGDAKATITGKILDQDGNPYSNGELVMFNKTTMESLSLTDAIQVDGTFTTETGPYPFNTYELIFATRGNVDRRYSTWGGSGILASITIDPDSPTRGLLGDNITIFGTSTDTIGTPFIPDEGFYELDVVNDKNEEILPVVIDGTGVWRFNATHDVEETITYTFKDGETVLASHSVEFFVGAGTLRDFKVNNTVAAIDETFTLTGEVYNTDNQLYRPVAEEAFVLRLDETTSFIGSINPDGTFDVDVTHDTVETLTYTFNYLETDYNTVDVRWCQTITLSFNGDSQPKAVIGNDAYVSVKVVDENGIAPEGRIVEFYEGDVSGTPLHSEVVGTSYVGYWPAAATVEGDVTIIAKLGEREIPMTLTWVGNSPQIAARFGRETTTAGFVVDRLPASGKSATLRGKIVDQLGAALAGPQYLKLFERTTFTLTDVSDQVQADGTFDIEIPAQADGVYEYSLTTEGDSGHTGTVKWDPANEDLKTVVLNGSVPTSVNVGSTIMLEGTIQDSDGATIAPADSLTANVTTSEGSNYDITITPTGTWQLGYTFSDPGVVLFDFHTSKGKYLGSVAISVAMEPPTFTSIRFDEGLETEGTVGTPVNLRMTTLDQYGDPIGNVSVRPYVNGEPGYAFRSPPDGAWGMDVNSDVAGEVLYQYGWEPNVPLVGHTVLWKLPVSSIESLRYSDSNAVPGQDAFAAFAALNAAGEGIEGVPITLHLDNASGTEHATVTTDSFGIAEFTIPQSGTDSSRLVYAKYGDVVKERRQWWASSATSPATGFANLTITSPVPNGERAMVSVQAVSKDGDPRPLASIGVFDRNTLDQVTVNKVSTGESKSFLLDFAGTGTGNYILVTDAGRTDFTVTWDDSVKKNPDGLIFDATSPDAFAVNVWTRISGNLTEGGVPVTDLNSYVKPTVTVGGVETYLDVNLDTGAFSAMVRGTAEGDSTYTFKLNDNVVATKTYKVVDAVTFGDMDVLTTTAPKVYQAADVGVVVKDGAGNSIPGVYVTWSVTGEAEPRGTSKSDEDGIATFSIPYILGTSTMEVVATVNSVTSATTVTWKASNELSDVDFETLVVPTEIYDLEKATITGKVINQSSEGTTTTKFDVYHRDMLTYTSHAADVQPDGTFSFEIGPFDIGVNHFYFCINGKREARDITVMERTDPKLSTVELDESNPTEGNSSEVLTVSGTGYDQYGELYPNGEVQWSIGGDAQPPLMTGPDGKFSTQVTNNADGPVVYSFGGNDGIPARELTITWTIVNLYSFGFTGPSHIKRTQGDAARLEVYLTDENGAGVSNASVVLKDKATGATLTTMTTNSRGTANYNVSYKSGENVRTIVATYDTMTAEHEVVWVPATTKYAAGFSSLYMDTRIASGKKATIRGKLADQDGNPITTATKVGVFNTVNLDDIDITDRIQPDGTFEYEYGPVADGTFSTFVYTDGGYKSGVLVWSTSNQDIKRVVFDEDIPRMAPGNGRVMLHGTLVDTEGNKVIPKYTTACTAYADGGQTFTGSITTSGTWSVEVYFSEFRPHTIDIVNSNNAWLGQYSLIVTPDNIITELPYSSNIATVGQAATMAVRVTDQGGLPVVGTEVTAHVGDPSNPAAVTGTTDALGMLSLLVPSPAESGVTTVYFKNGSSVLDAAVDWKPLDVLVGRVFQDVIVPEYVDYNQTAHVSGKLMDQNGDVLLGRNPRVYHVNDNTILNTTLTKNDETGFELQIAALPSGTHQLVLFVGNAETYEEITWEVQIPSIGKVTGATYSTKKAPLGVDATAYFYVTAPNGAVLADVPVKAYWGNASGEMIGKVMTDSTGLATFTIPGKDGEVDRTGSYTVYATVGGESSTVTIEWVDGQLIGSTMTRVDSMDVVVSGEKFLARMSVLDQNGDPMPNPNIVYYEPRIQVARSFTIVDYPSDDIVVECSVGLLSSKQMVLGTDNAATPIPIDWNSSVSLIAPVTAKVEPALPASNPIGQDLIVKGKVLDAEGQEFRPTTILSLKAVRTDTSAETNMKVMPDGEWAFVVNEATAGDVTYNLMYGSTQLTSFTVTFA
ncbi:putative invasin [Vibrio phage phiKT1019]|nr:putative invasin [Vibrio phage phiKT1019]